MRDVGPGTRATPAQPAFGRPDVRASGPTDRARACARRGIGGLALWALVAAWPVSGAGCASGGRGSAPTPAPARAQVDPAAARLDTLAAELLDTARARYGRVAAARDPAVGYPRSTGPGGAWTTRPLSEWTTGFFPGVLWLLYERRPDDALLEQAERWTMPLTGIFQGPISHDLGFQFMPTFAAAYRLRGEERFRPPVLEAARLLAGRYNPRVGATKSWDWTDPQRPFPVIVDNMMNLELLLWGARNGGDTAWVRMARQHARTTIANHVRPDGGSFHVVVFDSTTGRRLERITHQGYADASTWARGQAWLLHGFTIVYRETGEALFLATARRAADYFIAHLPADGVPCWDFQAPDCPGTTADRDASAAAIAASGLLELSELAPAADGTRYRAAAVHMLTTLAQPPYAAAAGSEALLLHATGSRPDRSEVDVGLIYGDYYLVQAMLRWQRGRALTGAAPAR